MHSLRQANRCQQRFGALASIASRVQFVRQQNVFERRQRRNQLVRLKHETKLCGADTGKRIFTVAADLFSMNRNGSAGWRIQTGKQAKQRTLSTAGRPHDDGKLAGRNAEVNLPEYFERGRAAAECLRQSANFNDGILICRHLLESREMISNFVSMLLSCSVLSVALLAGCGGGVAKKTAETRVPHASSGPPASPIVPESVPSQPAAPEKDGRPLIIAFGDSLTAGYGTSSGESYPDYLQSDLNARGYRYRVVNEGISGNTSKDGVLRIGKIVAQHPAVVIVAFGGNDGLRGIPILDTEKNLATIISTIQKSGAKVVLGGITLPPNYGTEYIARFNAMYEKQAQTFHVPLLPFMLKGVYGVPGDIQADGIHATAKGNKQVAKNFLPLLLPLLHKPRSHRAAEASATGLHP
jgi:acyl-CoA thioesterase I